MRIAASRRGGGRGYDLKTYSEKEKDIQSRLFKTVDLNFKDVPLKTAIEHLRSVTGLNIVADLGTLQAESVSLEQPITLRVDNISLKSALNLMLSQVHLTHLTQDEVLLVTTDKGARGKQVQKVYSVADLVIPFDDYMIPTSGSLPQTLERLSENQKVSFNGSQPAANRTFQLQNGQPTGQSSMSTAPSGNPDAMPLATHKISGTTFQCSQANILPVRPMPVCTSSATNRMPCWSQMRRKRGRKSSSGTFTPPSPWIGSIKIAATSSGRSAPRNKFFSR